MNRSCAQSLARGDPPGAVYGKCTWSLKPKRNWFRGCTERHGVVWYEDGYNVLRYSIFQNEKKNVDD
ncbi:hypothetical protein BC826DRAFT_1048436 [Russula brevipes]|nr:hypothetical protein BC826DRAFT_1048436 [Russula brevipes]